MLKIRFYPNSQLSRRCRVAYGIVWKRLFYDARSKLDTIFAPSTAIHPNKGSPVGIVRVSGKHCEKIIKDFTNLTPLRHGQQVDTSNHNEYLSKKRFIKPRTATLAKVFSPINKQLIDVGMLLWFPKPNSYTGEDVCEFSLHGSPAVMSKMLETLGVIPGVRPAEPGEFTFQAVSNNKMSLIQAESLPDLISSQTDNQRKLALNGLEGLTRKKYELWIKTLIEILAHLEASIDFGEDELLGEKEVVDNCIKKIEQLSQDISDFITSSSRTRDVIQSGIRVVILGKPNAGKSTFMNLLCNKQKSIVSDLSGTTRDVVEHAFELGGHSLVLSDTAGLKSYDGISLAGSQSNESLEERLIKHHHNIEKEGIQRALEIASKADIILYLIDASNFNADTKLTGLVSELESLINQLEKNMGKKKCQTKIHLVINKIDLNKNLLDTLTISKLLEHLNVEFSAISCKTHENYHHFIEHMIGHFNKMACGDVPYADDSTVHSLQHVNERHLSLLKSTERHMKIASKLNLNTIDKMSQHVRESVDYLSRIVGSVTNEQVLDAIFKDFCIGK